MKELRNYLTQKSTRLACGAGKFIQAEGHRDRQPRRSLEAFTSPAAMSPPA